MLYNTNEARKTAHEGVSRLISKLANVRPSEDLLNSDIKDLIYYLSELDTELIREMKGDTHHV